MAGTFTVSQLQPLRGYVLVQPMEAPKKTTSGIILPETEADKSVYGKVLAVGESVWESGVKELEAPVKKGDMVLFESGYEIKQRSVKINDTEYHFLKFNELIAIVK